MKHKLNNLWSVCIDHIVFHTQIINQSPNSAARQQTTQIIDDTIKLQLLIYLNVADIINFIILLKS